MQIFEALALIVNILLKFNMPGNTMEVVAEKSISIFICQLFRPFGIARFGTCNQVYVGSLQALPVG
jgi:hypothetical protein